MFFEKEFFFILITYNITCYKYIISNKVKLKYFLFINIDFSNA